MSNDHLKSYAFRRERERTWRELEELVGKTESGGVRSLTPKEVMRLPGLYRASLSSLSVARSISLDRNVLEYLEALAARAYFCVYGARSGFAEAIGRFFRAGFPRAIRAARWHIAIAALSMALGVLIGFTLVSQDDDWYYTFVPVQMAGERTPTSSTETLRAVLYDGGDAEIGELNMFASFLFSNNAKIGMLCFALGFALGAPVVLLLVYNGLTLGAFLALYDSRGLLAEVLAWLLIHGVTELLAVIVCGGAGLVLAQSLAFPGRHTRLANLALKGRMATRIIMGAVVMFFLAALLEGFGRQLINDPAWRYGIALVSLVFWGGYFGLAGRGAVGGAGNGDGR
jgi:uncharacterized membrane protein SpoIIM required for sporulation